MVEMAVPIKLRIVLGVNNSQRLTLQDGIPDTVGELEQHIKSQCGVETPFRLQFMDAEFGNDFTNLTSVSEIQDKGTLKLIFDSASSDLPGGPPPPPPYSTFIPQSVDESQCSSGSANDTDILSTPESSSSRSSGWPVFFRVPRFPYDCELQLNKANAAFKENGTLLDPDMRLKTAILESLAEEIVQYKVYPSDRDFDEVAEALVESHPCLKEPGSATGYGGWKVSLKYKLANYRWKLKRLGCPEVELNSLTNKPVDKCSPAFSVKKPRRAEVNYCPTFPASETAESLEKMRETLASEANKRNEETVAALMEKTFAHRRQEVIRDAPLIAFFKGRWPALFCEHELTAEFRRITTVSLLSKFFSNIDAQSSKLMRVFGKKGGAQGRRITRIMVPITQTDSIDVKRECILKALCVYLNEEPENLWKEYMDTESSEAAMRDTTFGIYVIRKEGAEPDDGPEEVGIILEGVEVLAELRNVPLAVAMLLALVYSLNLSYPPELKYTFEALQKIIMELDGNRLSRKNQALKTLLARY